MIKKGDCMKKYILLAMILLLAACGNDNLEQQEQALKSNNEIDTAESKPKEKPSHTTPSEDNTESEKDTERIEQMIAHFIEDMYIVTSLEDYRYVDEIVSEDFGEKIKNQFSETDNEENNLETDSDVGKKVVDIYKNTSNRSDEYVYILDLEIVNHDTENISKSQHIGKVEMVEESDTLKIDSVEELSNKQIN